MPAVCRAFAAACSTGPRVRRIATISLGKKSNNQIERPGGNRKINVRTSDNDLASLVEVGISRQRLAEWRVLRDAGPTAIDAAIDAQLIDRRCRMVHAARMGRQGARGYRDDRL